MPATAGAAKLVPEFWFVPHAVPDAADVMFCPGAMTSGLRRPSSENCVMPLEKLFWFGLCRVALTTSGFFAESGGRIVPLLSGPMMTRLSSFSQVKRSASALSCVYADVDLSSQLLVWIRAPSFAAATR